MIRLSFGGSLLLLLVFLFLGIIEGFWWPFFINLGLIVIQLFFIYLENKD